MARFCEEAALHIKQAGPLLGTGAEEHCVKRSGKLKLKQRRKGLNLLACTVCKWDYSQLNCIIYVHNNSIIITGLKLNYTVISIYKWLVKVENKYPILLMNICNHHVDFQWKHPKQICVLEKARNLPPKRLAVCLPVCTCVCVSKWCWEDGGVLPGELHTLRIYFPNSRRSKIQFPTLATSGAHQ